MYELPYEVIFFHGYEFSIKLCSGLIKKALYKIKKWYTIIFFFNHFLDMNIFDKSMEYIQFKKFKCTLSNSNQQSKLHNIKYKVQMSKKNKIKTNMCVFLCWPPWCYY